MDKNPQAADICDRAMKISLRLEKTALAQETTLADEVMTFCKEEMSRIQGHLRDDTLKEYMMRKVELRTKSEAFACVMYAANLSLNSAVDLALTFVEVFDLRAEDKIILNQMFSHEQKWVRLE